MSNEEIYTLLCAPLAAKSEYKIGEQVSYQFGRQIITGDVVWVSDGEGGQIYVVRNDETGFPDVVRGNELRAVPEKA